MSWRRFLEAERYIHIFPNVINWRDSAVEESFHNAKKRFWTNTNGLPCEIISLPDPDMYNDVIDWNNNDDVDPELILDLDREFVVPDDQEGGVIIGLHDLYAGYSIGWGDLDDDIPDAEIDVVEPLPPTGWGQCSNEPIHATGWGEGFDDPVTVTGWGDDFNVPVPATGWSDGFNEPLPAVGWGDSYKHIVPTGWGDDNNYELKKYCVPNNNRHSKYNLEV
ncbi:uncharacterized protein LOC124925261 [Impatiens glandulifera]|uniref:uncharacterized protein LOC124925261 n=1 Tax=Impatiens glandulifera TaxID=253017 RepID=UPI001FB12DDA|nr:uncharacterized protein LOC124925261 [Impatiens glandulifera]